VPNTVIFIALLHADCRVPPHAAAHRGAQHTLRPLPRARARPARTARPHGLAFAWSPAAAVVALAADVLPRRDGSLLLAAYGYSAAASGTTLGYIGLWESP
jgi:hypothetical protein